MPKFEIETPSGRFEVEAPDQDAAVKAIDLEQKAQALADQQEKIAGEAGAGELFGGGFTLGLKDKVAGLASGVGGMLTGNVGGVAEVEGFSGGYNVGRRAQEIIEERARQRSGGLGQAAEVAGTISSGVLAKAPAAATAIGRVVQGAKEAGTLAAVQGLGDSEADTVVGTAADIAKGGAAGAALGGAFTGAVEAGRGIVNAGRAVARGAGSVMDDEAGRASRKVHKALTDDDVSPGLAAARMQQRDTALVNVGDENILGLARAASAKPGEGRKTLNTALDAQQRASQGKILEAVDDALGGGDQAFNLRLADMIKSRAGTGNQKYEAAFSRNFGTKHSTAFDDIGQRVPGEAVRNAQRIAKAEGRSFGEQLIAAIDDADNVTFKRAPSLREWHYIQRGLRSAADSAYRSGVGEVGTAYKNLHKQLLKTMDEASPLYQSARKAYASESDLIDALQRGREILNPSTTRNVDALAEELSTLSNAEKQMVRIGLARQMEDMLSATPDAAGDMVKKIFGTKAKREAIRAAFPSANAFRSFESKMRRIAREAKSFRYVRTGSRTSFVDAEKADAGIVADAAQGALDMASGSMAGTTLRGVTRILRNLGGMDEGVAREVAKLLVEKDPDVVRRALSPSMNRQAAQSARTALMQRAQPFVRAITVGGSGDLGAGIATGR